MPKSTRESATRLAREQITERLVDAATTLLAEKGPAEIKARSVAEAANVSTMAVYYHSADYPSYSGPSSTEEAETSTGSSKRSVPATSPWPTLAQWRCPAADPPAESAPLRSGVRAVHTRRLPAASIADSWHQRMVRDVPGRLYPCCPGMHSPRAQQPHPWRPRRRDRRHPTLAAESFDPVARRSAPQRSQAGRVHRRHSPVASDTVLRPESRRRIPRDLSRRA